MPAMSNGKPPFRADHVGSLIRPPRLLEARRQRDQGALDAAGLRAIENDCIREAVALQESVGLAAITDGEFRRRVWYADFLTGFANVREGGRMLDVRTRNPDGSVSVSGLNGMRVTGKLARPRGVQTDSFDFLRAATSRTAKVCIPSPSMLHFRGGRGAIDREAYPDLAQFWDDLVRVYLEELHDLVARGMTYLQLDDTNLAYLCDENFCAAIRAIGEDPDALPGLYCKLINAIIRGLPEHVTVTIHLCRGNARAAGVAAGGLARGSYDPVREALFQNLDVDGYFLEYDDERSGDFAPLRFVPAGKRIVLGLVTTKRRELEAKDALKRRIDEAAKVVPIEQLCLSPQCGFSSGVGAKALSIDDEKAKLGLVVETAAEVWGAA
jgi:5-methyltetrahydropteroyltriglutamate--homocysteine methyltransferase